MKNLNTGKIFNMTEINNLGKSNAAHQFAEGSLFLEKVLLCLWKKNIKTTSCCSALFSYPQHLTENETRININVSDFSNDKIKDFLSLVVSNPLPNQYVNVLNRIDTNNMPEKSILLAYNLVSFEDYVKLGYSTQEAHQNRTAQVEIAWNNIAESLSITNDQYWLLSPQCKECVDKATDILTKNLQNTQSNTHPFIEYVFGEFDYNFEPTYFDLIDATQKNSSNLTQTTYLHSKEATE